MLIDEKAETKELKLAIRELSKTRNIDEAREYNKDLFELIKHYSMIVE
jgi:hypothetical protein